MHPVSIAAEKVFTLFGVLPVTNSLLTTWLVMAILMVLAFVSGRNLKTVPSGLQNAFEAIFEGFLGIIENVTGDKKRAREFFAYAFTIFLFILFSNWMGLIPGMGAIGFFETAKEGAEAAGGHGAEFLPLFRAGSSDLISEFAKIVSFSFRLFGNIFAGEVLLLVMTFLAPYIVPIPFYGLEVFVGMIQALVFMMLTLVFLNGATASHDQH